MSSEGEKTLNYIAKLFEAEGQNRVLLERINQTFVFVNETNAFLKIAKSSLNLQGSMNVSQVFGALRDFILDAQGQGLHEKSAFNS